MRTLRLDHEKPFPIEKLHVSSSTTHSTAFVQRIVARRFVQKAGDPAARLTTRLNRHNILHIIRYYIHTDMKNCAGKERARTHTIGPTACPLLEPALSGLGSGVFHPLFHPLFHPFFHLGMAGRSGGWCVYRPR